jgi:hypothetical protein
MKGAAPWLLGVIALLPASGQAEELGRLFFSPAERAALDARRNADAVIGEPADAAPIRVDGYVLRAGGGATVWVGGVPRAAGEVPIRLRASERSTAVRVGATVDPFSGAQRDLLPGGSLAVQR